MNISPTTQTQAPVEPVPMEAPKPVAEPSKIEAAEKAKAKEDSKQDNKISPEEMKQLAEEMNELMDDLQTSLGFSIREDMDHLVIVEIKDRNTNELIKQIPSEELLEIKEKMEEFTGLLFDQSV